MAYRKGATLPRFVGEQLPEFSVTDESGKRLDVTAVLDGKPSVLLFWTRKRALLEQWKAIEEAELKFGGEKVQAIALYIGFDRGKQERNEMFDSILQPDAMKDAGLKLRPRIYDATRSRYVLQAERGVLSGRFAIVNSTGKIINTRPAFGRFDFNEMALQTVEAILQSRDFIAEMEQNNAKRAAKWKRSRDDWNQRFQTSWNQ